MSEQTEKFREDPQFLQDRKEALTILGLYGGWGFLILLTAYIFGYRDPSTTTFIMGLPAWSFFVIVVGWLVALVAQVIIALKVIK